MLFTDQRKMRAIPSTDTHTVALNYPKLKTDLNLHLLTQISYWIFNCLTSVFYRADCVITVIEKSKFMQNCLQPRGRRHPAWSPCDALCRTQSIWYFHRHVKTAHAHWGWCRTTSPSRSLTRRWKSTVTMRYNSPRHLGNQKLKHDPKCAKKTPKTPKNPETGRNTNTL